VHLFFRRVPPCFILFLPSCSVCSVLGGFVSGGQFGFNSGRVLILGLIFMGFGGRPRLGGVCFGVYFWCSAYILCLWYVVPFIPVFARVVQRPG
jgi:hypothetical protein